MTQVILYSVQCCYVEHWTEKKNSNTFRSTYLARQDDNEDDDDDDDDDDSDTVERDTAGVGRRRGLL